MLTEKEVLARLAAAGFEIPPSRFAHWREKGLLPRTEPRPGMGRGRAAIQYPEITVDQTKQIARGRDAGLPAG
jgi:hypothetical protein